MSNQDLLEKVITTDTIGAVHGANGTLSPAQADRFIDYMYDATSLKGLIRTKKMREAEEELARMAVGERLLRGAQEAVDDGMNVKPAWGKVSLRAVKLRLDWELSTESLEDGLEGEAFEDHVARLIATQAGNDMEDVAINGDMDITDDPLLKVMDGWGKRLDRAAHVVDHGGNPVDANVWNNAIKAMPNRFKKNRKGLKFFAGSNVVQDYLFAIRDLPTNTVQGQEGMRPFGLDVVEVDLFNQEKAGDYSGATGVHSDVWLTDPQNLVLGVRRNIQVYKQFAQKKDSVEYTMYVRMGTAVDNPSAAVVVKNIKISG